MKTAPHPAFRRAHRNRHGGILITTLLMIAIMSMLAAATLYRVGSRHATASQSMYWNEALTSAEAGADLALVTLNKSLTSPSTAWAAWTPNDATTFPKTYTPTIASHSGDGNIKVFTKITVDQGVGSGWMRIRSTGVAELPARSVNGLEASRWSTGGVKNHRSVLRKASYLTDQTGGLLHLPQIARTIEILAKPSAAQPFSRGLTVKNAIQMAGSASIDSFDSDDPLYSTNGQYVAAKKKSNGNIASNSNGSLSNLQNKWVYGNAASNGGVIGNTGHVTGTVSNNFQTVIAEVAAPTLTNIQASPVIVKNSDATLAAGTAAAPKSYLLSEVTLGGNNVVTLSNPTPGTDTYINVYVTGANGISMGGTSKIVQEAGVHATYYVAGNMSIGGNGYTNKNNVASYLMIHGITPASGTRTAAYSGNGTFIGVINAPAFAINISGSGAYIGAAIGLSANLSGNGGFHYDEALADVFGPGTPASYTFTNWAEDIR